MFDGHLIPQIITNIWPLDPSQLFLLKRLRPFLNGGPQLNTVFLATVLQKAANLIRNFVMNQPLAAFLVPPRFGAPNRIVYEIGLVQTSVFIKWVSIQNFFTGFCRKFELVSYYLLV